MPPRPSSMPKPPPAVSPDHTNEMVRRSLGAVRKCTDLRRTERARRRMILEANAIEHVLPGRQTFEQCLGGEIGLPRRDAETQARLALMCRIENARHGGTSARAL